MTTITEIISCSQAPAGTICRNRVAASVLICKANRLRCMRRDRHRYFGGTVSGGVVARLRGRRGGRLLVPARDTRLGMTSTSDPPRSDVSGPSAVASDSRSLSATARRGALWVVASNLLLRLANVLLTAVVAHILSVPDFGVFAVALTAYVIVSSIADVGVSSCLFRADLDIDSLAPTVAAIALGSSAILAGAMVAFARPVAAALGSAEAVGPIRVMAISVLFTGVFAVPNAQLI